MAAGNIAPQWGISRNERFYDFDRPQDQREEGARDRDRILYTSAFRRLAGVTQVVAASEGIYFHNRLTHTLEVAQIARRLAQYLIREQTDSASALGGLDPEVAEAAALAHDLGHPPFGHVAERALDKRITEELSIPDGFEGNAQSFRVVTRLSRRHDNFGGLNLTRATLNAVLKYPWRRNLNDPNRARKWGAFSSEKDVFEWARAPYLVDGVDAGNRTLEAEVMDWSDDVAYAVHDVEDAYRAGVVPLDRLVRLDEHELAVFFARTFYRWDHPAIHQEWDHDELKELFGQLLDWMNEPALTRPYTGSFEQRAALRTVTAKLIRRYILAPGPWGQLGPRIRAPNAAGPLLVRDGQAEREVSLLKELIWQYVILNPGLASQQEGQKRLILHLFDRYRWAAEEKRALLPWELRENILEQEKTLDDDGKRDLHVRVATDVICSMTEQQAINMFQRLTGQSIGSVLDAIVG